MYIFKNAVKNLFRNKGRNVIVSIIILAMLTFTAISMIITTTTDNVIKDYKNQFGSEIYLQYDESKIEEEQKNDGWADIPEISDKIKIALADSKYLKETMISVIYPAYGKDLKGLDQGKNESNGNIGTKPSGNEGYYDPNLTIYGYNTPELMKDFKEGKRKIVLGEMFKNDNECVISQNFAKLNNLKVGDKIKISDNDKSATFSPLELTITGIYFDSKKNVYNYVSAATNPGNEILTTYNTMKKHQDNAKTKLYSVNTTYYLKNPDMLKDFDKEAHEKGLHKNYMMATDFLSYNKIVKPAESLANVSNVFFVAVLIIGSTILILLSILSIRERKYEIGVLRAMGMRKGNIVKGILYESLISTGVCLIIGLSIGIFMAQPISDMISLNSQTQNQNGFGNSIIEQEKIKVSLTPQAIVNVSVIAFVLVIVSSSVGVLYILRYEPMKILAERN